MMNLTLVPHFKKIIIFHLVMCRPISFKIHTHLGF